MEKRFQYMQIIEAIPTSQKTKLTDLAKNVNILTII